MEEDRPIILLWRRAYTKQPKFIAIISADHPLYAVIKYNNKLWFGHFLAIYS
ncbi:uncharacterized protein NEPG_00675 [Nematocida parisii ERTm1]|uniref:Uncharacterized protein n=1 Tax=Nematocida parisii (strain ERTm3) TaxID=935791 RepID=I3EKP0_NEMP3|nr:uncharacterized protein NEPG_00675 [Nematocida parisii ERTm1]EIJ89787.1 hypothetical protein NEQG_00557 [Nematocida parisii ERTm3]EIJ94010.1 hypothetical protein NEPG_00675 [Nematocida parisii ERTm1]|eukprot:XP_013058506.1 hypothetical protein NEPG_00675 [Nematocida parisii ERTm1]